MYMNRKGLIIFLLIFLPFNIIIGQHFLSTSGKAITNESGDTILFRGMGLGGWMVQEGYMLQTAGFASPQHKIRAIIEELIGEQATAEFYDAWLSNHVRRSDIDSLKSWGFNSVRLPMHYNLFTLPIEEEPVPGLQTWLDKGFELTDSLISWCKENEMYVILDLHAAPGGQGYDAGISDYDDTKPSLWESKANRDKTVALWKKLSERYKDEQWVAGYDLLNEPNWDLPGNVALRNLYQEITDSVRSTGDKHILFIEGNWFANDFTGLTPPWDDQLVYSPHKYWSKNDVGSMQWVLDLRQTYDVPLFLGESGENSNVWFRDAIHLFEGLDIGWAWWPLKKIASISCPLSTVKTPAYQYLLDYWSGNASKPDVAFATAALMGIANGLRTENCIYQRDVTDAMFRQVRSNETLPYRGVHSIPGKIFAPDFDMGIVGEAYDDKVVATYQVSTGNFTAWNEGWAYRNDGVDIEQCEDTSSNGYNVGFLAVGEWMQYEAEVAEAGVYNIHVRTASGGSGGRFHFSVGGATISPTTFAGPTGGWQNWQTVTIPGVILEEQDKKLRFHVDAAGFNVSSFRFEKTSLAATDLPAQYIAAKTLDEYNIKMSANKYLEDVVNFNAGEFKVYVNGNSVPILSIENEAANNRNLIFELDYLMKSTDDIRISYSGNSVSALDGTELQHFTLEEVENNIFYVHAIPGRIEAEAFFAESGTELEETTDVGGGQNVGYLDAGDYLDYEVNIATAGTYHINFRTAAEYGSGGLQMQLIDENGNKTIVVSAIFSATGGWQTWNTTTKTVILPKGRYTMRLQVIQGPLNLNWIESTIIATNTPFVDGTDLYMRVFPNPSSGIFNLELQGIEKERLEVQLYNNVGQLLEQEELPFRKGISAELDLSNRPGGCYYLIVKDGSGLIYSGSLIKQD